MAAVLDPELHGPGELEGWQGGLDDPHPPDLSEHHVVGVGLGDPMGRSSKSQRLMSSSRRASRIFLPSSSQTRMTPHAKHLEPLRRDGHRHGGLGRRRGVRRRERQSAEPARQDAVDGRKASRRVCCRRICHGKGGRGSPPRWARDGGGIDGEAAAWG